MDDSSLTEADGLSMTPTVAAILGIKGPVRFRLHGSTQKPHVILRRVTLPDDSGEDGERANVVYFSLFAQKRIEVKPGKEILLTVASDDGRFKDQPIMFEGDLPVASEASDEEAETQVAEEEEMSFLPPVEAAIPPKMRKAWVRRVEEVTPPIPEPSVVYTDVGVQAEPMCVSASTQATPSCATSATQTDIESTSVSIQADPPPPPSLTSSSVQTEALEVPFTPAKEKSYEEALNDEDPNLAGWLALPDLPIPESQSPKTTNSSPMELDSAQASPARGVSSSQPRGSDTPDWKTPYGADNNRSSAWEAPIPSVSGWGASVPSSGGWEAPVPSASAYGLGAPTPSASVYSSAPTPGVAWPTASDWASSPSKTPAWSPSSPPHPTVTPPPYSYSGTNGWSQSPARRSPSSPSSSSGAQDMLVSPIDEEPTRVVSNKSTPTPSMTPSRAPTFHITPIPHPAIENNQENPLSNQVSKAESRKVHPSPLQPSASTSTAGSSNSHDTSLLHKSRSESLSQTEETRPKRASEGKPSAVEKEPSSPMSSIASSDPGDKPQMRIPHNLNTLRQPPTAPASSNRNRWDTFTNVPSAPKALGQQINKMQAPATSPMALRQAMANSANINKRIPTQPSALRTSPPPDPKAIAYIPSGPSCNPLNIRPSGNPVRPPTQRLPPTAPKSLTQNMAKKRIQVGTGWPLVRGTNGASPVATPPAPSTPPPPAPSAPMPAEPAPYPPHAPIPIRASSSKGSDLPNILSYNSPSPPASATPTTTTASSGKWKRVSSTAPNVFARTEHELSQLFSQPSHATPDSPPMRSLTPVPPPEWMAQNGFIRYHASQNDLKQPESASSSTKTSTAFQQQSGKGHTGSMTGSLPEKETAPSWTWSRSPSPTQTGPQGQTPPSSSKAGSSRGKTTSTSTTFVGSAVPIAEPMSRQSTTTSVARPPSPKPAQAAQPAQSGVKKPGSIAATLPQPLNHPLPPKPIQAQGPATQVPRGTKRDRLSPDLYPEPRRRRRAIKWPTVEPNYTVGLKGEGDLSIQKITFNSSGTHLALTCADRTIRIWNNRNRAEIARLFHNAPVVAVAWMDGDAGVVSLGDDGIVSKWTKSGSNQWQWSKILDAGTERRSDDDPICFAYMRDRIAVSFPKAGVKVWMWLKGTWTSQRSILRQNVTALRFVDDGAALLGGTRDGVLWHCEIPNGTLRVHAFLGNRIMSLDTNATGTHALVAQKDEARLVNVKKLDHKTSVELTYSLKERETRLSLDFGAIFATKGQAVLYGTIDGCILVWDKKKATIVYGLEHEEAEDCVQAAASYDGNVQGDGCLVTGTKSGYLAWWSQPVAAPQAPEEHAKRQKTS
ncbi:hypothetical protein BDN72DRAFT_840149 [Pluteus cervinus]|uniref:Uncharacterized protein n=1 Tax=Pluteus cervinus TaxID=181527 RepID=A0ACD3AV96_9AGAR|nr:hypothetical protein BDN72DRAFT_840149 [Pluteus cervinus]